MDQELLVSDSNLDILLKALKTKFLTKYNNNAPVFNDASTKISILDIIKTTDSGSKLLADDGVYKDTNPTVSSDVITTSSNIWNLLNIKAYNNTYIPDIIEYQAIVNKTNTIMSNGNGDKVLNDKGDYVDVQLYRGLNVDELSSLCESIKGAI